MYLLDSTTKTMEIVLSGPEITNTCPISGAYADLNNNYFPLNALTQIRTSTNGSTAVEVVPSPAAGHTLVLKSLTIFNKDTDDIVVTFQTTESTTPFVVITTTVPIGAALSYEDGKGWSVSDSSGVQIMTFMDSRIPQTLAAGQLSSSIGSIYTAAVTVEDIEVTLCNTTTSSQYVALGIVRQGGSLRYMYTGLLDAKGSGIQGGSAVVDIKSLSTGDDIQGVASSGSVVDYTVWGAK